MNVAIGVYALLFGGVVLNGPSSPPQPTYPSATQPTGPAITNPLGPARAPRGYTPNAYSSRSRPPYGQRGSQQYVPQRTMPSAPTAFNGDPSSPASSPFLAPTGQPGAVGGGQPGNFSDQPIANNPLGPTGGPQPGAGILGLPPGYAQSLSMSPRRPSSSAAYASRRSSRYTRRPQPRSYAEHRIQQTQFSPAGTLSPSVRTPSTRGVVPTSNPKPFAGYNQRPTLSPYMGLFRDDAYNPVDNYNTYVKPRLEQDRQNVMVGGQIRSLQDRSRYQGTSLRSLNDKTKSLQGRGTRNYFMNRHGYFSGGR